LTSNFAVRTGVPHSLADFRDPFSVARRDQRVDRDRSPVPRSRAFYPFVITGERQIRGGFPSDWNDVRHLKWRHTPVLEPHMGEVIRFVPKSELERIRLVREARAIYDSIFPSADAISGQRDDKAPLHRG
jgi:hypothetical protein